MTHSQQHHVSNTRYVRTFFDLCLKNMIPFSTLSRIRHYRYIAGDYQFSYLSKCIHKFAPCKCNLWKKIWKPRFSFVQIKFIIATNCVKGVRIRRLSGLYFPAFGLYRERCTVSFRIQSEYRKTRTRKTSNTDTFHAVKVSPFGYSAEVITRTFTFGVTVILLYFLKI